MASFPDEEVAREADEKTNFDIEQFFFETIVFY